MNSFDNHYYFLSVCNLETNSSNSLCNLGVLKTDGGKRLRESGVPALKPRRKDGIDVKGQGRQGLQLPHLECLILNAAPNGPHRHMQRCGESHLLA